MKLEYCSATLSPYYPTLKPSVTQSKTYPQTKPLNLAISLSQSRLSLSQSPSQSCDLPLNLAIIFHKNTLILPFNLAICLILCLPLAFSLPLALFLTLSVSLSQGMSCSACIFNLSIGYLWVFVFVNLCALKLGVCIESGSIQNGYFKVCLV